MFEAEDDLATCGEAEGRLRRLEEDDEPLLWDAEFGKAGLLEEEEEEEEEEKNEKEIEE